MILLGGGGGGGATLASTHPKIKPTIWRYKDQEGLGVRKNINTTVKSYYQSSIYVECTVYTNNIHSKIQHVCLFFLLQSLEKSEPLGDNFKDCRVLSLHHSLCDLVMDTRLWDHKVPGSSPGLTGPTLNPFERLFTYNSSPHLGVK